MINTVFNPQMVNTGLDPMNIVPHILLYQLTMLAEKLDLIQID